MTQSNRWLTWANGVTSIRFLLTPLLVWAIVWRRVDLAVVIFALEKV